MKTCPNGFPGGGGLMGSAAHLMAGCCSEKKGKKMDKTKVRKTFSIDPAKCPKGILEVAHWSEDGNCKCPPDARWAITRVGYVTKIMEGAYAALEMLSRDELKQLEQEYSTRVNLQKSSAYEVAKDVAISIFIREAIEARDT